MRSAALLAQAVAAVGEPVRLWRQGHVAPQAPVAALVQRAAAAPGVAVPSVADAPPGARAVLPAAPGDSAPVLGDRLLDAAGAAFDVVAAEPLRFGAAGVVAWRLHLRGAAVEDGGRGS